MIFAISFCLRLDLNVVLSSLADCCGFPSRCLCWGTNRLLLQIIEEHSAILQGQNVAGLLSSRCGRLFRYKDSCDFFCCLGQRT